ncbi:MAG: cyclase family protein [Salinirussus sp.]
MKEDRLQTLLENAPTNWGKWGSEDEVGAVNYLDEAQVLEGIQSVEQGTVYTLGVPIGGPDGDPRTPGRPAAQHYMRRDRGHYESGKQPPTDRQGADDAIVMALHATTHVDALAHAWYDDELYNGFDPETTKGGLDRCSIEPIANHGVVGRGVLLDIARHRDVDHLSHDAEIGLEELHACAHAQGVELRPRDILVIRTGWLERFYDGEQEAVLEYDEPGITYTEPLAEWVHEMEIPSYATDTLASERTYPESGVRIPLHAAFLRDQGMLITEICLLDDLAADCAADEQYAFLYVCAPLKIHHGTASPVNPIVVK